MSLFSGDNEIGNMLQDAVKLKSAQMGQKRKLYETWPFFVQHTLFHSEKDDFKAWRKMPFDEKIEQSEKLKEEGNQLYKEKKFSDAVDKYEEAPSLFHYCYSTDPGWRKNNRGIDDDVIVLVDDTGADEDEKRQIQKLRLTCALNIAQCKLKLAKFDEAVKACDVVLELDPDNLKALYRRAEARVRPAGSTAYDQDCAIKDLSRAHQIDKTEKNVSSLLKTLQEERRKQRAKDRQNFEGMFGRGEIYDEESMKAAEALKEASQTSHRWEGLPNDKETAELRKRIDDVKDDDPLEKRIADAELLRDLYVRNDKQEEAQKLNEQIQNAKKVLRDQQSRRSQMDFSNPTPEMIEDAKKHGLDLMDPVVQAELRRIEQDPDGYKEECDRFENYDESMPPPEYSQASDIELPLPDAPEFVPIPWSRYGAVVAGAILILRISDVYWLLRTLLTAPAGGAAGGSLFARAYQLLFATSREDTDL